MTTQPCPPPGALAATCRPARYTPCPVLLQQLAHDLLHPEELGHAATPEIRDRARVALGLRPVESDVQVASYGAAA